MHNNWFRNQFFEKFQKMLCYKNQQHIPARYKCCPIKPNYENIVFWISLHHWNIIFLLSSNQWIDTKPCLDRSTIYAFLFLLIHHIASAYPHCEFMLHKWQKKHCFWKTLFVPKTVRMEVLVYLCRYLELNFEIGTIHVPILCNHWY